MNYTDYRTRRALVLSRIPLVVPRVSGRNVCVQIVEMVLVGDRVLASASSRELIKLGWKGSRKCLPAAYLTGLLAGTKAVKNGVKEAVLYLGLETFVPGSRAMAVLRGIGDAGISVPSEPEVLPADERIRGDHISAYAKSLLKTGKEKYTARFSGFIKSGFNPEDYPKMFDSVKKKILEKDKVKKNE